jgi:hypothetical protein
MGWLEEHRSALRALIEKAYVGDRNLIERDIRLRRIDADIAALYLRVSSPPASMSTISVAAWAGAKAISASACGSGYRVNGSDTCNSGEQQETAGALASIMRLSC